MHDRSAWKAPAALAFLTGLRHWLLWKLEAVVDKDGKPKLDDKGKPKFTKKPYQTNGSLAKTDDPHTWCDFDTAARAAPKYDGIGFALLNSGIAAFDIDDCRDPDTGLVHPWAEALVAAAGSFAEITPSGAGLRILGFGQGAEVHRKLPAPDGVTCELYRQATRYITVSGNVYRDAPLVNIDEHIDRVLAELDTVKEKPKQAAPSADGKKRGRKKALPSDLRNMLYLTGDRPAGYPSRSELLWAFLCAALRNGLPDDSIIEACLDESYRGSIYDHASENGGEQYVKSQLAKAVSQIDQRYDGNRPVIRIENGKMNEAWRAAEAALLSAECPVYVRGGSLVMPLWRWMDSSEKLKDGNGYRQTLVANLVAMNRHQLEDMLAHHAAVFQKFNQRSGRWQAIDPPKEMVEKLIAVGHWGFPDVVGIINTPTMRPDGSIFDSPGYDAATKLWYKPASDVVEPLDIPDKPTKKDALAALSKLKKLYENFPFETSVDMSVAIAGGMTTVLRGAIEIAPMFLVVAPEPGTGKSSLINLNATIATGRIAPAIACSDNEEEMEKRLTAAAISAIPIVNLNNLTTDLKSALLCQIITDKLVGLRVFHTNNKLTYCDCRNMTVFANGNGVTVVGDLVRRTLVCAMDAKMEKPETRTFAFRPLELVEENRREYLEAIFTIVSAHIAAGCPVPTGASHNEDFVQWSRFVQHPLMWLGMDDPLKSMDDARKNDPERAELSGRIQALVKAFSIGVEFTAGDVERKMNQDISDGYAKPKPMYPELIAAFSSTRGKVSTQTIGIQLGKDTKRPQGGHRLVSEHDSNRNVKVYKVELTEPKSNGQVVTAKTEVEEPF